MKQMILIFLVGLAGCAGPATPEEAARRRAAFLIMSQGLAGYSAAMAPRPVVNCYTNGPWTTCR